VALIFSRFAYKPTKKDFAEWDEERFKAGEALQRHSMWLNSFKQQLANPFTAGQPRTNYFVSKDHNSPVQIHLQKDQDVAIYISAKSAQN
jgi:hypothetical protein